MSMNRYYVECVSHYEELNTGQNRQRTMYLYVYAYSPEQVKDMLKENLANLYPINVIKVKQKQKYTKVENQ